MKIILQITEIKKKNTMKSHSFPNSHLKYLEISINQIFAIVKNGLQAEDLIHRLLKIMIKLFCQMYVFNTAVFLFMTLCDSENYLNVLNCSDNDLKYIYV